MGVINDGSQKLTFGYKQPLQAEEFNTLNRDILKPGIYSGGAVTIKSNTSVEIAPFSALIKVDTDKLLKITTSLAVTVAVDVNHDLIYATYEWIEDVDNWADFNSMDSTGTIDDNYLVFGKCEFGAGPTYVLNSISLAERTKGFFNLDTGALVGSSVDVTGDLSGATATISGEIESDTIGVSGQITSTVTTGTSPLLVSSTTVNTNLNADKVDGCDVSNNDSLGTSDVVVPTQGNVKTYVDNSIPVGSIIMMATSSAPTNYLVCNGNSISTSTYATLFAKIGYSYGGSGGSFNLPDYQGVVPKGVGSQTINGRSKSGPSFATVEEDQFQGFKVSRTQGDTTPGSSSFPMGGTSPSAFSMVMDVVTGTNGTPRTGDTTRENSIGTNFCIRYI